MILESHVGAKNDDKVFCNEYRDASLFSENWERGIKVDARAIKIFHNRRKIEKLKVPYLILVALCTIIKICTKFSCCTQILQTLVR